MFKFITLIEKAKERIPNSEIQNLKLIGFGKGADWMARQMGTNRISPSQNIDFFFTGTIKYCLCLLGATF